MRAGKYILGLRQRLSRPTVAEWSAKLPEGSAPRRHISGNRRALAVLAAGLAGVVAVQRLTPVAGPPLFDGVVVADAYRWLSPPPGQLGGAQGATGTTGVHGASPVVALATPEQPPQAQIFAAPGTLVLPPGTTSLRLSIEPVQPGAAPSDGAIAGNVYRIQVVNQAGGAAAGQPGGDVSIVLRGPLSATQAKVEHLEGGTWQAVQTQPTGLPATFLAVVTGFGDFALVVPGAPSAAPATHPASAATGATAPVAGTPVIGSGGPGEGESGTASPAELGVWPFLVVAAITGLIVVGFLFALRQHRRKH